MRSSQQICQCTVQHRTTGYHALIGILMPGLIHEYPDIFQLTFFSVFDKFALRVSRRISDRRFSAKAFSTEITESKSTGFFIHINNAAYRVNFNTKGFFAIGQERGSFTSVQNRRYLFAFWANEAGKHRARDTHRGERRGKKFLRIPVAPVSHSSLSLPLPLLN